MKAILEEQTVVVSSDSDLDRLEVGDSVRVGFPGSSDIWVLAFEGIIGGKYAFAHKKRMGDIVSWRSERAKIQFDQKNRAIFIDYPRGEVVIYPSLSEENKQKCKLFGGRE